MQTRKIAVEIKTVDERHCSKRCKLTDKDFYWCYLPCNFGKERVILQKDINWKQLRTKQCVESEIV